MTPTTPKSLVEFAMRAVGVLAEGQSMSADGLSDGMTALNAMLAQWNRRRWLIFHLIDKEFTPSGAESFTVGPGGDINMPRPASIAAARFRQTGLSVPARVDMPLEVVNSREDYAGIRLKNMAGWLEAVYYDAGYPLGIVNLWPVPQAGLFTVILTFQSPLGGFSRPVRSVMLPEEYHEAIWSNLAIRLGAIYPGTVVSDDTRNIAAAGLQTIRMANLQLPTRRMSPGSWRAGRYDIRTGMNG